MLEITGSKIKAVSFDASVLKISHISTVEPQRNGITRERPDSGRQEDWIRQIGTTVLNVLAVGAQSSGRLDTFKRLGIPGK